MRILIIILLGILMVSCGKKRSIHITALNAATGQPYAGLEYTVGSSVTGNNGEKSRKEATGFLDENGEAGVTIRVKSNRTYYVHVKEPSNTCYNKMITMYFDSPSDEDGHFNFEFAPCAYLKLNINNVNCQGITDIMNFKSRYSYSDWEGASTDRLGCYSFNSPDFVQVPAGWRIYQWTVNRNGVITTDIDSIFLNVGGNGTFNLNY